MFFVAFLRYFEPFCRIWHFCYAFLLQNQKSAHLLGWNYRKNYRKPINWHFSNYRQKYRYRFKTSSNYRWFEEIIGKVIDIEIDSKIIEKLSLWRSVRSCSRTIPEKVRNSRSINMGFKGWGWLLRWSWVTFRPFRCKKFNEWAQTANFSVFSGLRQELCAENPQNMEYEGN